MDVLSSEAIDKFIDVMATNIMRRSPLMTMLLNEDYIIPGKLLLHIQNALFKKSRKVRQEAWEQLERLSKAKDKYEQQYK